MQCLYWGYHVLFFLLWWFCFFWRGGGCEEGEGTALEKELYNWDNILKLSVRNSQANSASNFKTILSEELIIGFILKGGKKRKGAGIKKS